MDEFGQVCDRQKDTLSLKGLSFREAYVEGRLLVGIVHGRCPTVSDADKVSLVSIWRNDVQVVPNLGDPPLLVANDGCSGSHYANRRDQSAMLVSAIKEVQPVEVSLPTFEGLYVIEDSSDDLVAWGGSIRFMSIDGTFRRLSGAMEREVALVEWGAAVGADQFTICVVQASPEIVDDVTKHCLGMAGEIGNARLPRVVLVLSDQTARVCVNEMSKNLVEVTDVVFGASRRARE